jgi:hypothetical protein
MVFAPPVYADPKALNCVDIHEWFGRKQIDEIGQILGFNFPRVR